LDRHVGCDKDVSPSNATRPLNLAVVIDQRLHIGGGFQQSLNAALLVSRLQLPDWSVTCFTPHVETVSALAEHGIQAVQLRIGSLQKMSMAARRTLRAARLTRWTRRLFGANGLERALNARDIDLVYFVAPSGLARNLERTNFMVTVWDLCHRDEPEFPEVRDDREFERRERYHFEVLPKAVAVFADSELGASNIVRRYALDANRVLVMRSSPAPQTVVSECDAAETCVDVKAMYGLDAEYIFYPAQFWAHKNHIYIVQSLHLLVQKYGVRMHAIFAGGDAGGTLAHVRRVAQTLGVADLVHFAGFVQGRHMPALYRQAQALVMPTYFGPTNLPPLEALRLGTPVLYPRELVRAGGLEGVVRAIDLDDPMSLTNELFTLHPTKPVAADRQPDVNALALLARLDDDAERAANLKSVLSGFAHKRRCWA
jgi:glycosyltransferase involved in cell wall biosynthesis